MSDTVDTLLLSSRLTCVYLRAGTASVLQRGEGKERCQDRHAAHRSLVHGPDEVRGVLVVPVVLEQLPLRAWTRGRESASSHCFLF